MTTERDFLTETTARSFSRISAQAVWAVGSCIIALTVASTDSADAAIIFEETFENYADHQAFAASWSPQGTPPHALDASFGSESSRSLRLAPQASGAGLTNRWYRNLPAQATPSDAQPLVFSFDFYLDPAGEATNWSGDWQLVDIRSYGGGAFGSGTLDGLLAMGVSTASSPRTDAYNGEHFQGRIVNRGQSVSAYYSLDAFGSITRRSGGWHTLSAKIGATSTLFSVDGRSAELVPVGIGYSINSIVIGSDLPTSHPYWVDNIRLEVSSDPIPSRLFGDFDGNSSINAADLLIWRETFGSGEFQAADANDDGMIDGGDFLTWQRKRTSTGSQPMAKTMAELRNTPLNSAVTFVGTIATTVDLINSANATNFYLQDETGGIQIFGSTSRIDALLDDVSAGDKVVVSGVLGSVSGSMQILLNDASRLTVVDDPGVPDPIDISVDDLADYSAVAEELEGMLVKLSNVQFVSSGTFAGLTNYTVTDGESTAIVRVSTTLQDLVGQPIPAGPVNLIGQLAQFDASNPGPGVPGVAYQIYLRTIADVASISSTAASATVPEPAANLLGVAGTAMAWALVRLRAR